MAIINRGMDPSARREPFPLSVSLTGTGVTLAPLMVPYPCSLDAVSVAAFGLSGTPTVSMTVSRVVPGVGATVFTVMTAQAVQAYGTSGAFGLSLPQIGSTLTSLISGDVLTVVTGGANSAVTGACVHVILRPIQDIAKFFGL